MDCVWSEGKKLVTWMTDFAVVESSGDMEKLGPVQKNWTRIGGEMSYGSNN